jgi:hypothetical protein
LVEFSQAEAEQVSLDEDVTSLSRRITAKRGVFAAKKVQTDGGDGA